MAILTIINYPDPRLHQIAKPILEVNDEVRQLIDDMAETMYAVPGVGLAATQVDKNIQLIVIDTTKDQNNLQVFINPKIIAKGGLAEHEEGCLSVPGVYETVERAENVRVEALDANGEKFTLDAGDLLAICIQHEVDHLLGKVFVEYLSPLKRNRIRKRLIKQAREMG